MVQSPCILAGQSDEEIAQLAGTLPETIACYEAAFYDVRNRLANQDYIVNTVLNRSGGGSTNYDPKVKLFAYFGGPAALDAVLHGFNVGDRVADMSKVADYLDRHTQHGVRRAAALQVGSMEVNRFNVMQLMDTHARQVESQQTGQRGGAENNSAMVAMDGMLSQLQWIVGRKLPGKQPVQPIDAFDGTAAELRSHEAMQLTYCDYPKL